MRVCHTRAQQDEHAADHCEIRRRLRLRQPIQHVLPGGIRRRGRIDRLRGIVAGRAAEQPQRSRPPARSSTRPYGFLARTGSLVGRLFGQAKGSQPGGLFAQSLGFGLSFRLGVSALLLLLLEKCLSPLVSLLLMIRQRSLLSNSQSRINLIRMPSTSANAKSANANAKAVSPPCSSAPMRRLTVGDHECCIAANVIIDIHRTFRSVG